MSKMHHEMDMGINGSDTIAGKKEMTISTDDSMDGMDGNDERNGMKRNERNEKYQSDTQPMIYFCLPRLIECQ